MVWHFIGVYIIKRILHGHLELTHEILIFHHLKRNVASPRGHVISSMCYMLSFIIIINFSPLIYSTSLTADYYFNVHDQSNEELDLYMNYLYYYIIDIIIIVLTSNDCL